MVQDVSAFGFEINVIASNTFPQGFPVTQFADDTDPFDNPDLKIADTKMGINGDLITYSVASPIIIKVAVVPGSLDDQNLAALAQANRVGKGKTSAQDIISIAAQYPQGTTKQINGGKMTDAPVLSSLASAGRLKSKVYSFAFESTVGDPA
jgi:hypothetical protein